MEKRITSCISQPIYEKLFYGQAPPYVEFAAHFELLCKTVHKD